MDGPHEQLKVTTDDRITQPPTQQAIRLSIPSSEFDRSGGAVRHTAAFAISHEAKVEERSC